MNYHVERSETIVTPALLIFAEQLEANIARMLEIAGDAARLRPHCKTHKMREIVRLLLDRGVVKHKAATFAEAEMLAEAGARDVFLAYNLVGANVGRAVEFRRAFPDVRLAVTADHPLPIERLGVAMEVTGLTIDVLLDLDTGQHRTGVAAGPSAVELYRSIAATPGLQPGGLHLYDGQNHQTDLAQRRAAVMDCWQQAAGLRNQLVAEGLPVPRIVAGGTGSFPLYAELNDPALELSPGTCIFHDAGYRAMFPDLDFQPAALLLTRVVSRPTHNRITFDLGYKAVASDPPPERRVVFPEIPDARIVLQNEEHLVIETSAAERFVPGDECLAVPHHVCPSVALHKQALLIRGGRIVERWDVAARDRCLTV